MTREEAISEIKAWDFLDNDEKKILETLIPELKESEDERIRKALIRFFQRFPYDRLSYENIKSEEAIAWLEKQGEQETDERKEGNIIRHGGILALVIKGRRAMKSNGEIFTIQYPDEWVKAAPNEIERFLNELENRGEKSQGKTALEAINEVKVDNQNCVKPVDKIEPTDYNSIDPHFGKSIDKVEPKFNVGAWIVTPENKVLQITSIEGTSYRFNNESHYWEIRYCDEQCHLWSIQDAKDGDILQLGTVTAIFRKYIGNEHCKCYCSVCNGKFEIPSQDGDDSRYGCYNATPATKEQRDTLIKAMDDAGYTFDFEKKELKLLITNGGDFCESENCDGEYYGIDGLWHAKNILEETIGKVDGYQTYDGILEHKCAIEAVNKLYRQKPTQEIEPFEAEHGKYYYCIKDYFCGGRKQASKGDVIQALRGLPIMGLKDASEYFLPVNFAWSEENSERLQRIIDFLWKNRKGDTDTIYQQEQDVDWLKQLKQRMEE